MANLLLPALPSAAQAGPGMVRPGEPFPLNQFPRLDGKGFASLAAFRGKKVLLIQFASW